MPKSGRSRTNPTAGLKSGRTPAGFSIEEYDPMLEVFDEIERRVEADMREGRDKRAPVMCMTESLRTRPRKLQPGIRAGSTLAGQECQARASTTSRLRRRRFST